MPKVNNTLIYKLACISGVRHRARCYSLQLMLRNLAFYNLKCKERFEITQESLNRDGFIEAVSQEARTQYFTPKWLYQLRTSTQNSSKTLHRHSYSRRQRQHSAILLQELAPHSNAQALPDP